MKMKKNIFLGRIFYFRKKNIESYYSHFLYIIVEKKIKIKISLKLLEGDYTGSSIEGPGISCQCHPTCVYLIPMHRFTCSLCSRLDRLTYTGTAHVRPYGHAFAWTARADHVAEQ